MQEAELIKHGGVFVVPKRLEQQNADLVEENGAKRGGSGCLSTTGSFTAASGGNVMGSFLDQTSKDSNLQQADCGSSTGSFTLSSGMNGMGGFLEQQSSDTSSDHLQQEEQGRRGGGQTYLTPTGSLNWSHGTNRVGNFLDQKSSGVSSEHLQQEQQGGRGASLSTTGSFTVASGINQMGHDFDQKSAETISDHLEQISVGRRGGSFLSNTGSFYMPTRSQLKFTSSQLDQAKSRWGNFKNGNFNHFGARNLKIK